MRSFGITLAALCMTSVSAFAEVKVAASIKPIHSLVASVMQGVGTPTLIVNDNNSPHSYTMKPSDAEILETSKVIFWVGHELEAFLEKPIETLGANAVAIALMDTKGIATHPVREDENFSAESEDLNANHAAHDHGDASDAHIWLDPENAKVMAKAIAETLSKADPENASAFTANAQKLALELDALSAEIKAKLASAKKIEFLVFHDAYQYFEKRFDIPAAGALALHPENAPGAATISNLKNQIAKGKIKCVFSEPQFDDKLTKLLLEGTTAKTAVLDPLGASIEAGPAHYASLLRSLTQTLTTCLSGA
jgi:zinc transport system substrate-binding protein